VQVREGAGTIKYLYDLDKVVLERDGAGNLLARYTHEGGSLYHDLVSMKRGGASYYFLFDGLGSVTEVVDGSENTQNSYRYEAFGQVQSSTENVANPYRYVGAYGVHWDASAALYFMQARYYAPNIGRFITVDPVRGAPQDPRSLHRYLYVGNSPTLAVDPSGELAWIAIAIGAICLYTITSKCLVPITDVLGCWYYCRKYNPWRFREHSADRRNSWFRSCFALCVANEVELPRGYPEGLYSKASFCLFLKVPQCVISIMFCLALV